jgi:hypothetical protein
MKLTKDLRQMDMFGPPPAPPEVVRAAKCLAPSHREAEWSVPPWEEEPAQPLTGRLETKCAVCGLNAPYGYGVALRQGKAGTWYCREHRPDKIHHGPT